MNIEQLYEDMDDFYEDNPDLVELLNYETSEAFIEIVKFLDKFKPEWRKNKELGGNAPEFILSVINENGAKYIFDKDDDESISREEWVARIHEDIKEGYEYAHCSFQIARTYSNQIKSLIEEYTINGVFFEEEYNQAYAKFKEKDDERVYLDF
jgi:hypothetical protein